MTRVASKTQECSAGGADHLNGVQGQGHVEPVALSQQGPAPDACYHGRVLEIQLVLQDHAGPLPASKATVGAFSSARVHSGKFAVKGIRAPFAPVRGRDRSSQKAYLCEQYCRAAYLAR